MHRLSESVDFYEKFLEYELETEEQKQKFKYILCAAVVIMINIMSYMCPKKRKTTVKERHEETKGKPDKLD